MLNYNIWALYIYTVHLPPALLPAVTHCSVCCLFSKSYTFALNTFFTRMLYFNYRPLLCIQYFCTQHFDLVFACCRGSTIHSSEALCTIGGGLKKRGWIKLDANNPRVKSKPSSNQSPSNTLLLLCQSTVTFVIWATLPIYGCLLHWPCKV